jgi:hypothetical protein
MHLGYMRVSKADGSQALDLQRDALLAAGVRPQHLYEDLASGRRDDRPGLAACLKVLRPGDVLVVWKLGRDLRHLINTVHDLTTQGLASRCSLGTGRGSIPRRQPANSSSGFLPRWPSLSASSLRNGRARAGPQHGHAVGKEAPPSK